MDYDEDADSREDDDEDEICDDDLQRERAEND